MRYAFMWSAVWIVILTIPPGSREITTAYRINFWHGVISSVAALLCMAKLLPESITTPITLTYFVIDFINNLLNDFYFKVPSYHVGSGRMMEYFHHILCFSLGFASELFYKQVCGFDHNPFVELMLAEVSTPFLMLWRINPSRPKLILFTCVFFCNRILYHGLYFIPECIHQCEKFTAFGFAFLYDGMNVYFFYMMVRKLMKKSSSSGGSKAKAQD